MTHTTSDHKANGEHGDALVDVYDSIAREYDDRIPGSGPLDEMFTETEIRFLHHELADCANLLDLGCGTGRHSIPLAEGGIQVTGVDLSSEMLAVAARKSTAAGVSVDWRQANMLDLPFEAESFDGVLSTLALMHLKPHEREAAFCALSRVLRPGGKLVLSVKNAVIERLFATDRFATIDVTDIPNRELIFTRTKAGTDMRAPWQSFSPQDIIDLCALVGIQVTCLRGNVPLAVWLSDGLLASKPVRSVVQSVEGAIGDLPLINHLGYHLLVSARKPL